VNKKRALRFLKYFLMLFISLNFVTAIFVLTLNPGILVSVLILAVMTALSVVIAARDVSYIRWF
jgi:predicted membrane metal-binding protein